MMSESVFIQKISNGLESIQISPPSHLELKNLYLFHCLLQKWNQKINLTAHREEMLSLEKNFIDCIILSSIIDFRHLKSIIDFGSGAGFPGIVLKILNSKSIIFLIESDKRKSAFLMTVIRELNLGGIEVLNEHVQFDVILNSMNQVDAIVSRATVQIPCLAKLAEKNLKSKGCLYAMVSQSDPNCSEEIPFFESPALHDYLLPFSSIKRRIISYKKK
ncbi:MAG: 16S rRNA (guanine(527)-N(7))-methyltransferase RsmG [Deltaproteobacteria bacterium]|nr:16S rRNA (guanine(527)-N(7))-methyltransferase RsmG [Deltaproteobacteria bacterium]